MSNNIEIAESLRSTIVGIILDRVYNPLNRLKVLQDAVRELETEIKRLKSLAF